MTEMTDRGNGFSETNQHFQFWLKTKKKKQNTKTKQKNTSEFYLWSGRGDHHIGHEVIPFIHALPRKPEVSAQPALVRQHDKSRIPVKQTHLFLNEKIP